MSDVEARLALLEAERAIVRTLHEYAQAIDYGEEQAWLDLFTEDAVFDVQGRFAYTVRGRDGLRDMIGRHTRAPGAWHKHLAIEPVIEVDGDTATCASYLAVLRDDGGLPVVGIFGRYRDRLVRGPDGRWRFAERRVDVEVWRDDLPPLVRRAPTGDPT